MKQPELKEQKIVARWLKKLYDAGIVLEYTATPKHYSPYFSQINANSAAGVRRGFPDLVICLKKYLVFLEMKAEKGVVSPDQEIWHKILSSYPGIRVLFAYSAPEAIKLISNLIDPNELLQVTTPLTQKSLEERIKGSNEFQSFLDGTS